MYVIYCSLRPKCRLKDRKGKRRALFKIMLKILTSWRTLEIQRMTSTEFIGCKTSSKRYKCTTRGKVKPRLSLKTGATKLRIMALILCLCNERYVCSRPHHQKKSTECLSKKKKHSQNRRKKICKMPSLLQLML